MSTQKPLNFLGVGGSSAPRELVVRHLRRADVQLDGSRAWDPKSHMSLARYLPHEA